MSSHTRSSSDAATSTAAGSYQLILEHILTHPGTYEIPLRNMYHLNCLPVSTITRPGTPSSSHSSSGDESNLPQKATAQFTSSLFQQITRLPTQPCSLPPTFINSFLRRCFPSELNLVDFPQALTALDYLKDLEFRRRRDHEAALSRLGIGAADLHNQLEGFHTCIKEWAGHAETHERKIEALYSNLYVALRRWVLINELTIEPFSRHNCLAMLNTLYPPATVYQPTSRLTPEILMRQREGFFTYVQAVERKGPIVLRALMEQNKNEGDANGWPKVRDILDKYLRITLTLIEQYRDVTSSADMIAAFHEQEERRKRKEKADSGVSFGSADGQFLRSPEKRKASPSLTEAQPMALREKRNYSTLEKIARELRKFRESRKRADTLDDLDKDKENHATAVAPTLQESFQSAASAPMPIATASFAPAPSYAAQPSAETRMAKGLRKIKSLGDVKMARATQIRNRQAVPALPTTFLPDMTFGQAQPRDFEFGRSSSSMDKLRGFRSRGQTAYEV